MTKDLSNTFVGEEIEHAALTLHPAQAAAEGATRERLERIGGHGALIIDWLDATPLDASPSASSPTALSPSSASVGKTIKPLCFGASAIGMRCGNSGHAPPSMP
jgi:hypothetical protein